MGGWRAGGVQIAPQEKIGGAAPVWVLWRCHRHTASTANLFISGTANLAVLAPPTVETWRCHRHRQHRLGGVAVPVRLDFVASFVQSIADLCKSTVGANHALHSFHENQIRVCLKHFQNK